jgi:hypothetical protein
MFQIKKVEKIKTRILYSIRFSENRAVNGVMWKNFVEPDRPHMTIRHMRIVCRITKGTNTHSGYVIFLAFPPQQWLNESASVYSASSCLQSAHMFESSLI